MMKILIDKNNVVLFHGNDIELGRFDNEVKWKINEHLFAYDYEFKCINVTNIPNDLGESNYCYTETDGLFKNIDWSQGSKPINEVIIDLEHQLYETQLALVEQYEENQKLVSDMRETQLALCEIYELMGG